MADEAVTNEVKEAVEAPKVVATPAPEAPAAAKPEAPKAEAKPQPVKVEAKPVAVVKAKRVSKPRAAAAKKIEKTAPAKAPTVVRKAKPAAKPAKTNARPARAARVISNEGKIMNKQTKIETGLFNADQFRNVFGDVNERAKAGLEKGAKVVEELTDITRGNVEAFVASSKVAAKGAETLGQEAAEFGRKSFEDASAALKNLSEVRSAADFFKLQSDYARSAFDAAVAESARVSETFLKLAGDVAEPITSRYTVAAERVKTLAA